MTDFGIGISIHAPPQLVFVVLCDVERWPEWTASTTNVKRVDSGPFREGSRALIRQPKLRPAEWTVTALEEGRGFTWLTSIPGMQVTAEHRVVAEGDGSRVTLSLKFSGLLGSLVAWFYRDLNRRYLSLEAEGLRTRCESRDPARTLLL
jgi:uncharacterized membrane protein